MPLIHSDDPVWQANEARRASRRRGPNYVPNWAGAFANGTIWGIPGGGAGFRARDGSVRYFYPGNRGIDYLTSLGYLHPAGTGPSAPAGAGPGSPAGTGNVYPAGAGNAQAGNISHAMPVTMAHPGGNTTIWGATGSAVQDQAGNVFHSMLNSMPHSGNYTTFHGPPGSTVHIVPGATTHGHGGNVSYPMPNSMARGMPTVHPTGGLRLTDSELIPFDYAGEEVGLGITKLTVEERSDFAVQGDQQYAQQLNSRPYMQLCGEASQHIYVQILKLESSTLLIKILTLEPSKCWIPWLMVEEGKRQKRAVGLHPYGKAADKSIWMFFNWAWVQQFNVNLLSFFETIGSDPEQSMWSPRMEREVERCTVARQHGQVYRNQHGTGPGNGMPYNPYSVPGGAGGDAGDGGEGEGDAAGNTAGGNPGAGDDGEASPAAAPPAAGATTEATGATPGNGFVYEGPPEPETATNYNPYTTHPNNGYPSNPPNWGGPPAYGQNPGGFQGNGSYNPHGWYSG